MSRCPEVLSILFEFTRVSDTTFGSMPNFSVDLFRKKHVSLKPVFTARSVLLPFNWFHMEFHFFYLFFTTFLGLFPLHRLMASFCRCIPMILGWKWELRGKEHLEKDQMCIIVANHQTALDALGKCQRGNLYVLKTNFLLNYWSDGIVIDFSSYVPRMAVDEKMQSDCEAWSIFWLATWLGYVAMRYNIH